MAKPPRTPAAKDEKLAEYRSKRDFSKTPEPSPESWQARVGTEKKNALAFVVQKHDATRLHYDVRLEIDGAMMSFAVPKGPSYDPKVRRLAVETEDHPMSYNRFEGRIPDGEYGAGDVLLWDRGVYETVPPGQEAAMRAKGHIHARFEGEKLQGGWHFIRSKRTNEVGARPARRSATKPTETRDEARRESTSWLMIKAGDDTSDPSRDILAERPESVVSGHRATRGPRRIGASKAGKNVDALTAKIGEVAKATTGVVTDPSAYWFEIKYDGYRILIVKTGNEVRLVSRNGKDWTGSFALLAQAARHLPAREAIVDGEACAVDEEGRPSFGTLQALLAGERTTAKLAYAAFDLLWIDGRDVRAQPIEERRELLEAIVRDAPAPISFSRALPGGDDWPHLLERAQDAGLEGLIAKRKGSPYAVGHSFQWIKIKFERRQDCVIIGYIPLGWPQVRTAVEVGALLLAVAQGEGLRYAGRVGTGFDAATRTRLAARLDALRIPRAPVDVPRTPGALWAEPSLVCEVAFGEWTRDHSLRRPTFRGLREDKAPEECRVDDDASTTIAGAPHERPSGRGGARSKPDPSKRTESRAIAPRRGTSTPTSAPGAIATLTNPDKVLFPRDGITKRDVLAYYAAVAPVMLPHLAGRPLTIQRWPNGIASKAWYQQNAPPKTPPFVRLVDVDDKGGSVQRIVADNVETLGWLANLAALTLHVWASHVPSLDKPDYVVIDLDPGDGTWRDLVEVAMAVRALLEALELDSAVKTTGKRGLHVVVPIAPGPSHTAATAFGERMAQAVAKVLPKIATVERMKDKRGGRLYVDYLQNGFGKTIVSPYTIRALDGAPVSTPVAWSEVTEKLDPKRFTLRTVLDRIEKKGDLFAAALRGRGRIPPAGRS